MISYVLEINKCKQKLSVKNTFNHVHSFFLIS